MNRFGHIRNKIENIMLDQEQNPSLISVLIFKPVLYVFSLIYTLVVSIRLWFYQIGFFKSNALPCKVISIGNISVGGTGKTPMTLFIANQLLILGYRTVIISRGYKGELENDIGIVHDGQSLLIDVEKAGDEPFMMAAKLKKVPVIVGRNRYEAGKIAIERFDPDVILLDDGFQHMKLRRDADFVLLDYKKPFGNGHLAPRGILREPIRGLKRAAALILTRAGQNMGYHKDPVMVDKPVFIARYQPRAYLISPDSSSLNANPFDKIMTCDTKHLKNKPVFAFCGIARNNDFANTLGAFKCDLVGKKFYADHHAYDQNDLEEIVRLARQKKAQFIATTEKDYVKVVEKISSEIPVLLIGIEIEIDNQFQLIELLQTYIKTP